MASQRLLHRVGNLHMSPVFEAMEWADQEAFNARVLAVEEFGDLTEHDQALIRKGELAVSAGAAPALQDPSTWGDWAAIDAALDADDLEALDRELEKVGPDSAGVFDEEEPGDEPADDVDHDEDVPQDGDDEPAVESAGWVGV